MKVPVVDIADCIDCGGCVDLCPEAFEHSNAGYIEVISLPEYPEAEINDVIKLCPGHCIFWEEE
jgi:ferredoxin